MRNSVLWSPVLKHPDLKVGEIHVWRAHLNCDEPIVHRLSATLASDEVTRASRFVFQPDRNDFVVTRGALRVLLAKYLKCSPKEIHFNCNPRGKPFLILNDWDRKVQFSISHSHGMALLAFAVELRLGVDVELVLPDFACDDLAPRYFSQEEVLELRALPSSLRTEGFFRCWTRKEAYIKARGEGLQIPLQSFRVSVSPKLAPRLDSNDSSMWKLVSLNPGPGYVGALVGEGKRWRLRLWDWMP